MEGIGIGTVRRGELIVIILKDKRSFKGKLVKSDSQRNITIREVEVTTGDGLEVYGMSNCQVIGTDIKSIINPVNGKTTLKCADCIRIFGSISGLRRHRPVHKPPPEG